jgi:tetratricopeptide (TPR) repeat protein
MNHRRKGGQAVTNRNLRRSVEYFLVLLVTGAAIGLAAGDSTAPLYAAGQRAVSQDVLDYGNVVNEAALKGDGTMLAAARLNLTSMLSAADGPNDLRLLYYTAGYASWEFSLQAEDVDSARGAIFDAAAQLRESLLFDSRYAEAHILQAMVHARLLKLTGGSVPYDPAIGASLAQLASQAPRNPRAVLATGVVAFLAPEAFSKTTGDAEEALKTAQVLFAAEPNDNPWPGWGKAQTEAWLGQVLAQKGDIAGARQAYGRALALRAGYAWVTDVLMPALK